MGEDIEEAQELAMDATRGADDARQEGVGDTRPRGVGLPVATHLCRRRRLEELVGLGIPERPVEADIGHVIAAELVNEGNINDEVGVSADVGSLDDQVTLSGLAILFLHGRDVAPFRREACLVAEAFDRVEDSFVSGLGAACVLAQCRVCPSSSVNLRHGHGRSLEGTTGAQGVGAVFSGLQTYKRIPRIYKPQRT